MIECPRGISAQPDGTLLVGRDLDFTPGHVFFLCRPYPRGVEAVGVLVSETERPLVMLIDDDRTTLAVLRTLFIGKSYRVATRSESLGTAAELLQDMPDLIVLDINMPGLSGDRLAQVLRTHRATKKLPIMLYSGAAEEVLRAATLRAPPARFVCKAQGPQRLVTEVQRFLREQASR